MSDSEARYVGVKRNSDGSLDYSRAAKIIDTKNEREKTQEVPLPKDWTFLIHGSNLNRKEWKDDNIIQLDVGILTIKGMGLSAVSKKEKDEDEKGYQELREKGLALGTYDTTAGYSSGEGMALEIRVLFPSFHSRSTTLS